MQRNFWIVCTICIAILVTTSPCRADAFAKVNAEKLEQTHQSIQLLAKDRKPVSLQSGFHDYRAILHCHSGLSHDSRASVEEIVKAAHHAKVQVIMFSEHPAPAKYDYYTDGHHGVVEGVLLIPGAEELGLLSYPTSSVQKLPVGKKPNATGAEQAQDRVDQVRNTNGQVFLSHLEERMNWDLNGPTGTEIYNTHADVKDELRWVRARSSPIGALAVLPLIKKYRQEVFSSLLDYPADYLRRYDELCLKARLTGVAANDSHHNQGVVVILDKDKNLQIESPIGEHRGSIDADKIPDELKPFLEGKKPGDTVLQFDSDPYEYSFGHVSTHLLMNELNEAAVRSALDTGRVYVAFDWLGDPTGFVYQAVADKTTSPMGAEVPLTKGLTLQAEAPLPGTFHLLRNGKEVAHAAGRTLSFPVTEAGNYRVEVWLTVADEPQIWILSNPIFIRAQ